MSSAQQPSWHEGLVSFTDSDSFNSFECDSIDCISNNGSSGGDLDLDFGLGIESFGLPHPGPSVSPTSSLESDNFTEIIRLNSSIEDDLALDNWSTVLLVIILASLIVVTIVGNVLVCLSVVLVRKLRKPGNYLLVSLALSDLFVALFVMPFAIVFEVHGARWPLNYGLCDLWVSADVLCCTASILNLCGISCDRYRAITKPLEYSAKTTPRLMLAIIFVVWLLSACVSLPPVLLLGNVHTDIHGKPFCSVSQNFWYQIYATMASFYVPLCVMVVVYVKILRVVADKKKQMSWKHQSLHRTSSSTTANSNSTHSAQPLLAGSKKDSVASSQFERNSVQGGNTLPLLHAANNYSNSIVAVNTTVAITKANYANNVATTLTHNNNKATANGVYFFPTTTLHRLKKESVFGGLKEHKASTVLGIIMSAFVICWLPFFILAIMRPFLSINNIEIPGWVSSLFNWLGYANSALNPLIYATLNRDFRRPFKEILCFRCRTLDTVMRREFYQQQYGDDRENAMRRASRHHIQINAPSDTLDNDDPDQQHEPVCV